MIIKYIFATILIAFSLIHIIAPQLLWRKTAAWQFRNPSAVEPSKAGYTVQRIGGAVTLIIGLVILFSNYK